MPQKTESKPKALELEIEELEVGCTAGCGTSSTHPRCTCPISTALFTARTVK
ncbi:MAG TPA: hypothetical protein VF173_29720 [Thermoanaerobaculia bacterium]|nr:hypothetical protein [Thermoanaerobaculia bacterium]